MIIKYWKGWHNPENMDNHGYLEEWKEAAEQATKNKSQLVIFEIPFNRLGNTSHDTIEEIEKLLQEKYG